MEDVLTEVPPPSRFFLDDLNNFAIPSPPLPPPLLLLSPNPNPNPNPKLLIVALSAASLAALRRLPSSSLAGTLILPELPLSPSTLSPSPSAPLLLSTPSALVLSLPSPVPPPRSRAVAKTLLDAIKVDRILIFDSIHSENFRGRLSVDETLFFKLETSAERLGEGGKLVGGVHYLPSGSVMDGVGAAVLGECQMRGIRATLVGTWSGSGGRIVGGEVVRNIAEIVRGLGVDVEDDGVFAADSRYDSDLYT